MQVNANGSPRTIEPPPGREGSEHAYLPTAQRDPVESGRDTVAVHELLEPQRRNRDGPHRGRSILALNDGCAEPGKPVGIA